MTNHDGKANLIRKSRKRNNGLKQLPSGNGPSLLTSKENVLGCLLLALGTVGVYFPVVSHPFISYLDPSSVVRNSPANSGLSWQSVKWALTAMPAGNWQPLTWISHALDFTLFGLYAGGHHITSLLVHVLNVVLLFGLLVKATGATWRSFVVASVFALHPLNVESVAWAGARDSLLSAFFFFLVLGAYGWYAQNPQFKRYVCVAALFVLGLACGSIIVTLPFVFLLLDFWPLGRVESWSHPALAWPVPQTQFSRLILEKLPLLALAAARVIVTITAQSSAVGPASNWSLTSWLANGVQASIIYLWKTFFPWRLAPIYPTVTLPMWELGIAALFLLTFGLLVWRMRSSRPYLITGYLWFLGALVPVITLVQLRKQSIGDAYAYIPLIGISLAIVWCVCKSSGSKRLDARLRGVLVAVVLLALSLLTWRQLGYWRSDYDLWSHTLQVTKGNFEAEENLALTLMDLHREDEAILHFQSAKKAAPGDPVALLNIGNYLEKHGSHQQAIAEFEGVVRQPKDPVQLTAAYTGLGVAYAQLGEFAKARENLLSALWLNPRDQAASYDLSMVETEDGVEKMSVLVSAHPTAQRYVSLGQLLQQDQRFHEAEVAYRKALRLEPHLAEAAQALHDLTESSR